MKHVESGVGDESFQNLRSSKGTGITVSKLLFLPSEEGSTLKGKNLPSLENGYTHSGETNLSKLLLSKEFSLHESQIFPCRADPIFRRGF